MPITSLPVAFLPASSNFIQNWSNKRKQGRFFLGEHGRHLPFRGAMNARIGPAFFPTIQRALRFLQTLEAQTFERSLLRVSDTCFHFSFAIGIFNPAGHGHDAVVCQHIPKEWIESRVVDVSDDYALAEIIEYHDARTPTESTEGFLM